MGWLAQAGVPSSEVVSYDMGCPQAFASPSDIENAIVKFQQNGVKDMTEIDELGDFAAFTNTAQSQGYHPKWLLADDGLLEISSGTQAPNSNNINNAVAIATLRDGENNTPSIAPHGRDPEVQLDPPTERPRTGLRARPDRKCLRRVLDAPSGCERRPGTYAGCTRRGSPKSRFDRLLLSSRPDELHERDDGRRGVLARGPVHDGVQLLAGDPTELEP